MSDIEQVRDDELLLLLAAMITRDVFSPHERDVLVALSDHLRALLASHARLKKENSNLTKSLARALVRNANRELDNDAG